MTDFNDPIDDLEACARALTEGHNPAEIADSLHGIARRLRDVSRAKAGTVVEIGDRRRLAVVEVPEYDPPEAG